MKCSNIEAHEKVINLLQLVFSVRTLHTSLTKMLLLFVNRAPRLLYCVNNFGPKINQLLLCSVTIRDKNVHHCNTRTSSYYDDP